MSQRPSDFSREIRKRLSEILDAEELEVRSKLSNPFWSSNGHSIANDMLPVIDLLRKGLAEVAPELEHETFATELKASILQAHSTYERIYQDPDGFGGGLFRQIKKKMMDCLVEHSPRHEVPETDGEPDLSIDGQNCFLNRCPDFEEEAQKTFELGYACMAARNFRAAFDFFQIHLLQEAIQIYSTLNHFSEEEFLVFRARISHVRGWMIAAITRGDFSNAELCNSFRWIGGAGSLLTFLQKWKTSERLDMPQNPIPSSALESLPFVSFSSESYGDELSTDIQISIGAALSSLGDLPDDESRNFLFSMFPDVDDFCAAGTPSISILAYINLGDDAFDSPHPGIFHEVQPAVGVWLFILNIDPAERASRGRLEYLGHSCEVGTAALDLYQGASHAAKFGQDKSGGDLELMREKVSSLIWHPVAHQELATSVIVIAEGALSLIPFSALLDQHGTEVICSHVVITADSYRSLLSLPFLGVNLTPSEIFVIGDPLFSFDQTSDVFSKGRLRSLPESKTECNNVGSLFGVEAVLGKRATKSRFLASVEQADFLHLATHGVLHSPVEEFDLNRRFASPSKLLEDQRAALFSASIAFAADDFNEHFLSAVEISRLNLYQMRLALLSLCVGAAGSSVAGEAALGITRAFLAAGCATVIGSLLPLGDTCALTFSDHFYERISRGESAISGFYGAQSGLAARGFPWFSWAGYQCHI